MHQGEVHERWKLAFCYASTPISLALIAVQHNIEQDYTEETEG